MRPEKEAKSQVTIASTRVRLALGMASFGSATPVSKLVTDAMPVFVAGLARVTLGAAVLLPFVIRDRDQLAAISRGDWLRIGAISLFGMFGFTAFMLYGMRMVSGVVGATVMSSTPAVTALASVVLLKENMTWRKGGAIALAVCGVLVLQLGQDGNGQGSNVALGAFLVFCAVCCEVAYTLLGKQVSEEVAPNLTAGLSAAMSIPLFAFLALWQIGEMNLATVGAGGWIALVWYGIGTLALGSWLWYSGLSKAEGTVAAAFMGIMPASALVLSYVLLDEEFRVSHLAGFLTVFAGVLLISWEHARMSRAESA